MRVDQKGVVLLAVLLIMSVMMMLSLSQWQSMILLQRLTRHTSEQARLLFKFEDALRFMIQHHQVEKGFSKTGQLHWSGKIISYQVDDLGDFPCIHRVIQDKTYSTRHAQVKLYLSDKPDTALVVRLANLIPLSPCLHQPVLLVHSAYLSWDYLYS